MKKYLGCMPEVKMDNLECFAVLADEIRASAGSRRIVYVPNPGNFGDGLIRYATKRFFSDNSIEHIEINIGFRRGKVALLPFLMARNEYFFVYGGGGAWCEAYDFGLRNVHFISRFTDHYLVLPSTYEKSFSRKIKGIAYRRDHGPSKDVIENSEFCHDMAFYLAKGDRLFNAPADGSIAQIFRTDRESARGMAAISASNLDLSKLGDHMSNGDEFLRLSSLYSVVNTDRLHVAIASALSGADVMLYPGNYFKIKEIYISSIQKFFPGNVTMVG